MELEHIVLREISLHRKTNTTYFLSYVEAKKSGAQCRTVMARVWERGGGCIKGGQSARRKRFWCSSTQWDN
jgi:hypothetical protein